MKSIMLTIAKYVALLAAVAYLCFAVVKFIRPAAEMECQGIELLWTGDSSTALVTRDDVMAILDKHGIDPVGLPFQRIDIAEIDSVLNANPYIDSVVTFPNSYGELCIRMAHAEPLLHVFPAKGKEFYLASNGKALPAGGQNLNLCIVTGNVSPQWAADNLLTLGKILRDDPYWRLQAQQVNVADDKAIELIPRTGSHTIILGDTTRLADKLSRVRLFYERAMPVAGWDTYETINAEFDGQLVCTRSKKAKHI